MALSANLVNSGAGKNDCAIITTRRNSGEFSDRNAGAGGFKLSKAEMPM